MEKNNRKSLDTTTPRHVLAVQKSQRIVAKMQADRMRRRAEESEQIEAAKQSAAIELSRARQLEREKFKKREYKIAADLGKLVLVSLRIKGLRGVLLDAQSIESQWTAQAFVDLRNFLISSPTDFYNSIGDETTSTLKKPDDNGSGKSEPNSNDSFPEIRTS